MTFELHPNLLSKIFIIDLPISRILMEDEKNYPWFFLVPRIPHISKLIDLPTEQEAQVFKELSLLQKVVWKLFSPKQLNVAAIGNKTPQLHIHVIARFENDPAWPGTIWVHTERQQYDNQEKEQLIFQMKSLLERDYEFLFGKKYSKM